MSSLNDAHLNGSRSDHESATHSLADHYQDRAGLIFAWARQKIGKVLLAIAPPTKSSVPSGRGYSALGAKQEPIPGRRPITDVFPIPTSADQCRKTANGNQPRL